MFAVDHGTFQKSLTAQVRNPIVSIERSTRTLRDLTDTTSAKAALCTRPPHLIAQIQSVGISLGNQRLSKWHFKFDRFTSNHVFIITSLSMDASPTLTKDAIQDLLRGVRARSVLSTAKELDKSQDYVPSDWSSFGEDLVSHRFEDLRIFDRPSQKHCRSVWNVLKAHDIICCEYSEWDEYMDAVEIFERIARDRQWPDTMDAADSPGGGRSDEEADRDVSGPQSCNVFADLRRQKAMPVETSPNERTSREIDVGELLFPKGERSPDHDAEHGSGDEEDGADEDAATGTEDEVSGAVRFSSD